MSTLTQREAQLRPRPKRSRGAAPELAFAWESFRDIADEVVKLWPQHYKEIALDQDVCPLDPDWRAYFVRDEVGVLHVLTARSRNGKLAGYCFNLVGGHDHYAGTRFANTEMFWLHPYFRKGWQPVRMLLENLRGLKERGVQIALISFKLHFQDGRVGKLLYRLGYRSTDIVMRKVL